MTARSTVARADIPVLILAGGRGARFNHETEVMPKPMIRVAGKPMVQHIWELYAAQGFRKFVILGGYLGHTFVQYLASIDDKEGLDFDVVNTGDDADTAERLLAVWKWLPQLFMLTYGDGVCDVDLNALLDQHERRGRACTLTVVRPPGRFGAVEFDLFDPGINQFLEKPHGWINGGFMAVSKDPFSAYLAGRSSLESSALPAAARNGQLDGYRHEGYWACMDTRRDLEQIEAQIKRLGRLPWSRAQNSDT